MGVEWVSLRLGSVCSKIGSGATPRGGKDSYLESGEFALIRSQNVYNDRFSHTGIAFLSQAQANQLSNVEVQAGDVLVNITGDSVARVCQVDPSVLPARVNQHVAIVRPDPQILDPEFLRYFLVQDSSQSLLLSLAGAGATRSALTKGMLESLQILAPKDVATQRRIARTLGTLDDKIELNRRMAATLEEMARAIFKSWFIDFDPVRAKAEGRPTNLPPEIDALFPDSFEDSELGPIPQGWGVSPLSTLCTLSKRQTMPASRPHVTHDHYSLPAFDKGQMPSPELGESILSQKFVVEPGSVLMSKLNPETPRVWYVGERVGDFAICSTEFLVLLPSPPIGAAYLYCLAMSQAFRAELEGMVTGTSKSHQRAQPTAVMNLNVVKPDAGLLSRFESRVEPMLHRCLRFRSESDTLASIRDTLLPKLISGELSVSEVESANAEARA